MQTLQDGVWSAEFRRRFFVLPAYRKTPSCAPAESVLLIAGRTFLRDFNVSALVSGVPVEDDPNIDLSALPESGCSQSPERVILDAPFVDQDIIYIPFSEQPEVVGEVLDVMVSKSWVPMRHCPHWSARLRLLEQEEPRDDAAQRYVFELSCDNLPAKRPLQIPNSALRFSKTAYDRLNSTQREAFDGIVQDYEQRGWWIPCTQQDLKASSDCVLDPAVVFMVPGGEKRRDRLVVDLRRANKRFERGSGAPTTVTLCIAVTRLYGSGVCWVFDAAKAFYKLRWVGLLAVLLVKGLLFISRRCVFGVTTGPGSLRHTMGALVDGFRSMVRLAMLILCFADDVFCGGIQGVIAVCSLIWLLTVCGFCITRKKFQCMALPSCREEVGKALDEHGLPGDLFRWSDSVDLLGCSLRYEHTSAVPELVASCNRRSRLQVARGQAERLQGALRSRDGSGISKSFVFSLGGNLSYDCLGCHAVDRVIADALRSWFARIFASEDWSSSLDFTRLDEVDHVTACALADWIVDLTTGAEDCHHATPVREDGDPIILEVASDAATTGAGYVISIVGKAEGQEEPRKYLLGSGSWRFTAQQRHYHSNRRELAACCRAVQAAVDIVSHFAASVAGEFPPLEFVICSDNKPTVAWLQGRGSISRSSLERRAVIRTLNALKDEIDHLKSLTRGAVTIRHIAGQDNSQPDALSRLFDRIISLPSGRRISLADGLHGDPDDIKECPDLFDEPQGEAIGANVLMSMDVIGEEDDDGKDVISMLVALPTGKAAADSYLVANSDEDKEAPIPLVQHLCGNNWDLQGVSADFLFLRKVLNALRPAAKRRKIEELEDDNEDCLIRSLQSDMDAPPIRPSGPFLFDEEKDIYVFRNGAADGGCTLLPVVPEGGSKCRAFRTKLLFDAHRASKHSTLASTVSLVYDKFFVSNLRAEVRRFMKNCFPCQLLRARRTWDQLPGAGPNRNQALNWEPYREVFVDVLALGDIRGYQGTTKVLTVYCLHTFHSCWVPTGESMKDIVAALARVQTEQGGVSLIWCDQAAYFRSSQFSTLAFKTLGARTRLLTVRSPWKSGGGERMHGLGLRIAKMLLRGRAGYVGRRRLRQAPRIDLADICREVTFLLNTRPLDFTNTNEPSGECVVVTPDLLAKGFTRKRGCLLPPASSSFPITRRLKVARTYFLTNIFRDMRLAVAKSMGYSSSRGKVLQVDTNSPVLVYHPEKKLSPGFRLAHVVEVLKEGRLIKVKFVDGSESEQHHFNVVPLLHNPELSQQRGRIVD